MRLLVDCAWLVGFDFWFEHNYFFKGLFPFFHFLIWTCLLTEPKDLIINTKKKPKKRAKRKPEKKWKKKAFCKGYTQVVVKVFAKRILPVAATAKNCFLIISRKKCGDCFCKIHLDLDNPPGGSLNLLFFFYFLR